MAKETEYNARPTEAEFFCRATVRGDFKRRANFVRGRVAKSPDEAREYAALAAELDGLADTAADITPATARAYWDLFPYEDSTEDEDDGTAAVTQDALMWEVGHDWHPETAEEFCRVLISEVEARRSLDEKAEAND